MRRSIPKSKNDEEKEEKKKDQERFDKLNEILGRRLFKSSDQDAALTLNNIINSCDKLGGPSKVWSCIPKEEKWRFFIDGRHQGKGKALLNKIQNKSSLKPMLKFLGAFIDDPIREILNPEKEMKRRDKLISRFGHEPVDRAIEYLQKKIKPVCEAIKLENRKLDDNLTLREFLIRNLCGFTNYEERERGYLAAVLATSNFLFSSTEKSFDLDLIKDIHRRSLENVTQTNYADKEGKISKPGHLRLDDAVGFRLASPNTSCKGLEELLKNIEKSPRSELSYGITIRIDNGLGIKEREINNETLKKVKEELKCQSNKELANYIYEEHLKKSSTVLFHSEIIPPEGGRVSKSIEKLMNELLSKYHRQIAEAKDNRLEKLHGIIQFVHNAEQLHPFRDGNCRTLCMLSLNYLLLQNGFPPVILEDPNRFDCYTADELVNEVLEGMKRTLEVANGRKDLYEITTDEILRFATKKELASWASILEIIETAEKLQSNKPS